MAVCILKMVGRKKGTSWLPDLRYWQEIHKKIVSRAYFGVLETPNYPGNMVSVVNHDWKFAVLGTGRQCLQRPATVASLASNA